MRSFPSLFFLIFIILSSCGKPAGKTITPATAEKTETCPDYFYFYNEEKVTLRVRPQILLVGFRPDLTFQAKAAVMKRYPEFENISPAQAAEAGAFHIIKLKASTTCPQTLALLQNLKQQPEIIFANPAYHSPARLGNQYLWLGLTAEFLVTVKSVEQKESILKLIAQTNTQHISTIGETTFLIAATKNSQGNALEMANYFHEQPDVINAEPNFYLAVREGNNTSPGNR